VRDILPVMKRVVEGCGRLDSYTLHYGTNNLDPKSRAPETPISAVRHMRLAVEWLHQTNPDTVVFLSAMLPRPTDFSKTDAVVREFNNLLQLWAQESYQLIYMHSNSPFLDKQEQPILTLFKEECGLHPSPQGTYQLKSTFARLLVPFRLTGKEIKRLQRRRRGGCQGSRLAQENTVASLAASLRRPWYSQRKNYVKKIWLEGVPLMRGGAPRSKGPSVGMPVGHSGSSKKEIKVMNVKGPKDPGSNFWKERFVFEGRGYGSLEQAYQAWKAFRYAPVSKIQEILRSNNIQVNC